MEVVVLMHAVLQNKVVVVYVIGVSATRNVEQLKITFATISNN